MLRKQPVQRRSQLTCDAILEATVQVLLRQGPGGLTTGRVAERAGVSIGTLYQYFSGKEALIAAVREKHVAVLLAAVRRGAGDGSDTSPSGVLRATLTEFLRVKRENLDVSRALIALAGEPWTADRFDHDTKRFAMIVAPILPDTPDRMQRAEVLVAALEGILAHAVLHTPDWLAE
ncbi:TetR/AcrR family transcriptional regulator, partial [Nostoc sp. NIES-2111]